MDDEANTGRPYAPQPGETGASPEPSAQLVEVNAGAATHAGGSAGERTTAEVFCNHLELRRIGKVDEDIERNYHPDVVLLTTYGVFEGHAGVRSGAALLQSQIGDAEVTCTTRLVRGEIAFLEWTARSDTIAVDDGADTFLIRDGRIVTKTIHYTVRRLDGDRSGE